MNDRISGITAVGHVQAGHGCVNRETPLEQKKPHLSLIIINQSSFSKVGITFSVFVQTTSLSNFLFYCIIGGAYHHNDSAFWGFPKGVV